MYNKHTRFIAILIIPMLHAGPIHIENRSNVPVFVMSSISFATLDTHQAPTINHHATALYPGTTLHDLEATYQLGPISQLTLSINGTPHQIIIDPHSQDTTHISINQQAGIDLSGPARTVSRYPHAPLNQSRNAYAI